MPRAYIFVGRILVLLLVIFLIVMPWAESSWHFDNFPFDGEDFELSVFVIVAFLGLVLVLSQHCKKGVSFILALGRRLSSVLQDTGSLAPVCFGDLAAARHIPPLPSLISDQYNLPIRI